MSSGTSQPELLTISPLHRGLPIRSASLRRARNMGFVAFCIATAAASLAILAVLLGTILWQGLAYLDWDFLTGLPNPDAEQAGIWPALWGTVWVCTACWLVTLPLGVATAVLLEEFKPKAAWVRKLHGFVQLNITNLAGVPSVVYGILGLTAFAATFGLFGNPKKPAAEIGVDFYHQYVTESGRVLLVATASRDAPPPDLREGMPVQLRGKQVPLHVIGPQDPLPDDPALLNRTLRSDAESGPVAPTKWYYLRLPLGRGVLAGALTLMLVILPIVIIASQESLRAVPDSLREAALGMGCTRWQMVRKVTLPAAVPGIMTGSILAMSRAIGEAAPILIVVSIVYIAAAPQNLMDDFTVMPLQIYYWTTRPQHEFHNVAASAIIVLLCVLLTFNALAVFIREKLHRPLT